LQCASLQFAAPFLLCICFNWGRETDLSASEFEMGIYKWLVAMVGAAIALMLLHDFTHFFSGPIDLTPVLFFFGIFTYLIVWAIDRFLRWFDHVTAEPDEVESARNRNSENGGDGTA
jgi:hypothetical protein